MFIDGKYFANSVSHDFFHNMCGEMIGEGEFRVVYDCILIEGYVVKIETISRSFCNVMEWEIWQEFKNHALAKWLAPIHSISPSGIVMLQRKTEPLPADFEMPKKIPPQFADLKRENWGLLDGRLVCHDYGNHAVFRVGSEMTKINAKWR